MSKVRHRSFACVAMGSALLFIVRSSLLIYSAGSGVNRVQVVLSGFSKRLFCFVQAKTLCRYGCMYFLAVLVLVCVDVVCYKRQEQNIAHTSTTHNQLCRDTSPPHSCPTHNKHISLPQLIFTQMN